MRIKTRLQISAALAIAIALVLALIFTGAARQVQEASTKSRIVDEIVKGVFELNVLTFDYLQHPEERAREQWLLKHTSVADHLASAAFTQPDEAIVLARMRQNHEAIKTIFSRLAASRAAQPEADNAAQALQERLIGQLSVESQTIFSGAFQLAALNRADVVAAQQKAILLATLSLAILVAIMAATAFLAHTSIARPIARLTQVADDISRGSLDSQIKGIGRNDEIGILAQAFKRMADHLIEANAQLEQRVASRTRRLEIVASLGERLSAILDLEELLASIVQQIKANFDYYHAHIYLLDPAQENLIVAAGTGQAGAHMKAQDHAIPLHTPTSLVARAARTGQIVRVDDVHQEVDWLPNPLLPHTRSEMAVPITLGEAGGVIGVLDVQQDKLAGLDEGDANLLRSLASQVAVAIRNARLFEEVRTALDKAQAIQERYLEQSWAKINAPDRQTDYYYARPGLPPLAESSQQLSAQATQQAFQADQPIVITLAEDEKPETLTPAAPPPNVVVAPITLHNQKLGLLHLYPAAGHPHWQPEDLAMIQTVIDRLVQTADNLRLYEETRERASREQLIGQIADKLRRAPDMETLMQTGVSELARILEPARTFVRFGSPDQLTAAAQPPSPNREGPEDESTPVQPPSPNGGEPEDESHNPQQPKPRS
jgi:GAF domain-containing protein/HAMP domain-containing protein